MNVVTLPSSRREGWWGRVLGRLRGAERRLASASGDARGERRRSSRRARPALQPGTSLEPRALLSAGVVGGVAASTSPAHASAQGRDIDVQGGTIVLPPHLQPGKTYPLVVAFSYNGQPLGNQYTALRLWQTLGPDEGVIVYASNVYSNKDFHAPASYLASVTQAIKSDINAVIAKYPVDRSHIILTGLSGGGNYAEYFNLTHPGFAAAVIDNSGRVPLDKIGRASLPSPQSFGHSARIAVFMASPSDSEFYADAVRGSVPFYNSLGWHTRFYSFPGGHNFAPFSIYQDAFQWIESQPSWK